MEPGQDYGKPEMMAAAIIREIKEGDVVFHGLASPTPMVAMKAAKALGKDFCYVTLSNGVNHDWSRAPYCASTLTENTYTGSVACLGLESVFDLYCSGKGDIAFLSCLQMDKEGRIAMSYLGGDYDHPKLRGPGGAGSATLAPVAPRTVIWKAGHDKIYSSSGSTLQRLRRRSTNSSPSLRPFAFSENRRAKSTLNSIVYSLIPLSRL